MKKHPGPRSGTIRVPYSLALLPKGGVSSKARPLSSNPLKLSFRPKHSVVEKPLYWLSSTPAKICHPERSAAQSKDLPYHQHPHIARTFQPQIFSPRGPKPRYCTINVNGTDRVIPAEVALTIRLYVPDAVV